MTSLDLSRPILNPRASIRQSVSFRKDSQSDFINLLKSINLKKLKEVLDSSSTQKVDQSKKATSDEKTSTASNKIKSILKNPSKEKTLTSSLFNNNENAATLKSDKNKRFSFSNNEIKPQEDISLNLGVISFRDPHSSKNTKSKKKLNRNKSKSKSKLKKSESKKPKKKTKLIKSKVETINKTKLKRPKKKKIFNKTMPIGRVVSKINTVNNLKLKRKTSQLKVYKNKKIQAKSKIDNKNKLNKKSNKKTHKPLIKSRKNPKLLPSKSSSNLYKNKRKSVKNKPKKAKSKASKRSKNIKKHKIKNESGFIHISFLNDESYLDYPDDFKTFSKTNKSTHSSFLAQDFPSASQDFLKINGQIFDSMKLSPKNNNNKNTLYGKPEKTTYNTIDKKMKGIGNQLKSVHFRSFQDNKNCRLSINDFDLEQNGSFIKSKDSNIIEQEKNKSKYKYKQKKSTLNQMHLRIWTIRFQIPTRCRMM